VNQFQELTKRAHFNRCPPRVAQGATRVRKGTGYRPRGVRAAHDVGTSAPRKGKNHD